VEISKEGSFKIAALLNESRLNAVPVGLLVLGVLRMFAVSRMQQTTALR